MPRIINAYSEGQNSIADSLKSIGQSIWGDEAKNEGLRQNAEKLRQEAAKAARENTNAEPYARAMRDNDMGNARYYGALHGLTPEGIGVANRVTAAGRANGNYDDPALGTSMLGAGQAMASTPEGQRRALENAHMQPTYGVTGEDPRTGAHEYGWRDPRDRTTAPSTGMPQPGQAQPPRGFSPPSAPANPSTPQAAYTPADMITDERGQPVQIPSAPLHLASSVDENGQPILDTRGRQALEAVRQKYGDGYASRVLSTILGHVTMPGSRSKANNAFMDDVLGVYPNYDQGVARMRNDTYKDIALGGRTGQIGAAVTQGINHMTDELIPNASKLDTWHSGHFGPFTKAANSLYISNLAGNQDPRLAGFNVAKEGFANEFAKIFRTQGNMAEADIEHQRQNFLAAQSPEELQATVKTAMGLMHGSLSSREATIQRILGADAQRPPMVGPETKAKLDQIQAWLDGGGLPQSGGKNMGQAQSGVPVGAGGGGGTQPATALPPNASGHPPSINDRPQEHPMLAEARAAIAAGKSRAAVIQRLQQMGVDPQGL